jgi:hypothetical protein
LKEKARDFTRLSNRECIEYHIDPRHASAEVILVSDVSYKTQFYEGSHHSLLNAWENGYDHYTWNFEYNWVCDGLREGKDNAQTTDWTACTKDWILPHEGEPSIWKVYNTTIEYCLQGHSANNEERCGLHFSRTIFVIVAVCLLVEAALISTMARIGRTATMVTLGDAQAEFLNHPDEPRQASEDTQPVGGAKTKNRHFAELRKAEWSPVDRYKLTAVGPRLWIGTVVSIIIAVLLGLGLFTMSLVALKHVRQAPTLQNVWRAGIGRINHYMLIGGAFRQEGGATQVIIGHVLFANIFQLVVSMVYLLYNSILTCQVLADQWIRFMATSSLSHHDKPIPDRKPLRVSSHVGLQRTSYMLSLPWLYAAPMMLVFTVLHTLVARSVFLVRTAAYGPGPDGARMGHRDASRVGFSSMGILLSTILGFFILLSLLFNSFRRYYGVPKHLPRMGNKTAFISAACQRPDGDTDAYLLPVTLMAVNLHPDRIRSRQTARRWVLSTDRDAEPPEVGEQVEQPMPADQHDDWYSLKQTWNSAIRPLRRLFIKTRRYDKVKQGSA